MTSEDLKQSLSMRDVIGQYGISVDKNGFCKCPFHKEKTASMKVYRDSYFCYGCSEAGDIFSFVQKMEHVEFRAAFLRLGGTYEGGSDYQHGLRNYRLKKRRETEQRRKLSAEQEKQAIFREISLLKTIKLLSPVFSDDWCYAVNRLEYLFYEIEYLTEKRWEISGYNDIRREDDSVRRGVRGTV